MNPLFFFALTTTACGITHYSVSFLEPSKASWYKAAALSVLLVIGSNIARWAGFNPQPLVEWAVYILVTAGYVHILFKLKPFNSITVGTCYVAGSYLLAQFVHFRVDGIYT